MFWRSTQDTYHFKLFGKGLLLEQSVRGTPLSKKLDRGLIRPLDRTYIYYERRSPPPLRGVSSLLCLTEVGCLSVSRVFFNSVRFTVRSTTIILTIIYRGIQDKTVRQTTTCTRSCRTGIVLYDLTQMSPRLLYKITFWFRNGQEIRVSNRGTCLHMFSDITQVKGSYSRLGVQTRFDNVR